MEEEGQRVNLDSDYLYEDMPDYPRPEFHVSRLKHDTDRDGLRGIRENSGFRNPREDSLLWWSLAVGPEDITAAETRLLETTYPDRTEEQVQMQHSFLEKFATSPAFTEPSRLGSYRFTFPLEEVLGAYRDQFCDGEQPVMRVFRTVLYKQEVMYVVLVHSPANQEKFSEYPELADDPNAVCSYRDGRFIWRSQAMCGTHRYELVRNDEEKQMEAQEVNLSRRYYVWDHFAVALDVDQEVLKFNADKLRENLKFCTKAYPTIARPWQFDTFDQAKDLVKELWPDYPSPREKA